MTGRQYAAAGVDLAGADAAKARIAQAVAGARTALSLGEVGAFGGMVRLPAGMRRPVPDGSDATTMSRRCASARRSSTVGATSSRRRAPGRTGAPPPTRAPGSAPPSVIDITSTDREPTWGSPAGRPPGTE